MAHHLFNSLLIRAVGRSENRGRGRRSNVMGISCSPPSWNMVNRSFVCVWGGGPLAPPPHNPLGPTALHWLLMGTNPTILAYHCVENCKNTHCDWSFVQKYFF